MAVDLKMLEAPLNLNEALDPVISAIDQWKKDRGDAEKLKLQQAHEAELARKDDLRYNSSIRRQDLVDQRERAKQDLAERRFQGQTSIANAQARQGVESKIRAALAQGDQATAEMLAKGYSQMDPASGAVQDGIPFQRLSQPEAPVAPALDRVPDVPEGPRINADDAERADLMRSLDQPGEITTSRDARAAMGAGDEARTKAEVNNGISTELYNRQAEAYKSESDNPRFKIGDTEVDQNSLRYAAANKDATDFESYAGTAVPPNDPDAQAYVKMLAGAVRGKGMTAQQAAKSLDDYKRTGFKQDFAAGQNDARNATTLEKQRLANQRPQASMLGLGMRREDLDLKERKEMSHNLRSDIKSFVERYNAKTTQEAAQEFPHIIGMLDSGNGKLQQQALITMMRLAQKDNRFSDADARLAFRTGAGWLDQAESWAQQGMTGELGPGVLSAARKAAQVLHGYYKDKSSRMADEGQSFLRQPNYYDPREAGQILSRELPGFTNPYADEQAAPAQAPAARPAPGRQPQPAPRAAAPAQPHEVIPGVIAGGGKETTEQRKARLLRELSGGGR